MKVLRHVVHVLALVSLGAGVATGRSQGSSAQQAADADTTAILARAREVMGFATVQGRILHLHAATAVEQPYQSDRTYPPFFSNMNVQETWFDPVSRVQRTQERIIFPGAGPAPELVTVDDGRNAQMVRGSATRPIHRRQAVARHLDPWAVVADWSAAGDVRIAGREIYRDYPRIVLTRETAEGVQRLFIDPKSGFPVKLDLVEPHYLWGQQRIEYVWSTWIMSSGVSYPGAAFRLADGAVEYSCTNGDFELVAAEAAPALAAPAAPEQPPAELPLFLQPVPITTTEVAAGVWLLSNPGYKEIAAEVGGEVFLLDSTQGEERAALDAEAIRKLFPAARAIHVVVTDLAWPHIAGIRYWVAQGATIISHRAAREFLQRVIDRKWTDHPDLLERKRTQDPASVQFRFSPIDDVTDLAHGHLRLIPIDGIASEVALMAYLPDVKVLWASDFIQTVDAPSQYAREVIAAAARANIQPERVAAEHLPVTAWSEVLKAQTRAAAR